MYTHSLFIIKEYETIIPHPKDKFRANPKSTLICSPSEFISSIAVIL